MLTVSLLIPGFAVLHYLLVYRREKFLIEYLDEDDAVCLRLLSPCSHQPDRADTPMRHLPN